MIFVDEIVKIIIACGTIPTETEQLLIERLRIRATKVEWIGPRKARLQRNIVAQLTTVIWIGEFSACNKKGRLKRPVVLMPRQFYPQKLIQQDQHLRELTLYGDKPEERVFFPNRQQRQTLVLPGIRREKRLEDEYEKKSKNAVIISNEKRESSLHKKARGNDWKFQGINEITNSTFNSFDKLFKKWYFDRFPFGIPT